MYCWRPVSSFGGRTKPKDTGVEGFAAPRETDWDITGGSASGILTIPLELIVGVVDESSVCAGGLNAELRVRLVTGTRSRITRTAKNLVLRRSIGTGMP